MTKIKDKKGFTLIELLIVIAIIGILSSTVMVSLNSARKKARDANRKKTIKSIATLFEMYYVDHGYYPGGYGDPNCDECANGYVDDTLDSELLTYLGPYMTGSSLPSDPVDTAPHKFYYDAKHYCGGRPSRAHLYGVELEATHGNVDDLCTGWGGEGMSGSSDTGNTWTIEFNR